MLRSTCWCLWPTETGKLHDSDWKTKIDVFGVRWTRYSKYTSAELPYDIDCYLLRELAISFAQLPLAGLVSVVWTSAHAIPVRLLNSSCLPHKVRWMLHRRPGIHN